MLPDVGPAVGDELPRGPSGEPGRADGTRKWISKWDGLPVVVSELPSADVPASAPVVDTLDAFKEALDLVLDEYLNGFDPSEAARCILELRVRAAASHATPPAGLPEPTRGTLAARVVRQPAPPLATGCLFVFSHASQRSLAALFVPGCHLPRPPPLGPLSATCSSPVAPFSPSLPATPCLGLPSLTSRPAGPAHAPQVEYTPPRTPQAPELDCPPPFPSPRLRSSTCTSSSAACSAQWTRPTASASSSPSSSPLCTPGTSSSRLTRRTGSTHCCRSA